MDDIVHIGRAAQLLNVTPQHLRTLERAGRIPRASRDRNGRTYSESDLALLKDMGIGARPRRLRSVAEVLGGTR